MSDWQVEGWIISSNVPQLVNVNFDAGRARIRSRKRMTYDSVVNSRKGGVPLAVGSPVASTDLENAGRMKESHTVMTLPHSPR